MSEQRLCEGGIEIGTGPCRVCGRTAREHCGKPLPDPRDARIAELESENKLYEDALASYEQRCKELEAERDRYREAFAAERETRQNIESRLAALDESCRS